MAVAVVDLSHLDAELGRAAEDLRHDEIGRAVSCIPMRDGIELAGGIPGARFVPVESPNHVWLADEPAWGRFTRELEGFLREVRP